MERVIRTRDDLRALRKRGGRRGITRVVLDLPGDVGEAERAINRDLRSCGCEVGSVFVALGIVVSLFRHLFSEPRPSIAYTIALVFALALMGKAVGIALAEYRLRAAIARLL